MPHMEGIFINGEKAKFHPEDILDTDASQYTEEIGESVTAYLTEHITNPSNPPIDTSLSIAGAAADAKKTGDEISQLKSDLNDIENLEDITVKDYITDFAYGRIGTTGDIESVTYCAYSPTVLARTDTIYFDATHYRALIAYYEDAAGTIIKSISGWKTTSPVEHSTTTAGNYCKIMIATLTGTGTIDISSIESTTFINRQVSTELVQTVLANTLTCNKIITAPVGNNLYDAAHNSVVQSDPQYTIGTIYLNGYVGDLAVSCDGSSYAYISNPVAYNANGDTITVTFDSGKYSPRDVRSGKVVTIPNGAVKFEFRYRTSYSGGTLVTNVMVTKGDNIPTIYEAYEEGNAFKNSPYLTKDTLYLPVYVSSSGNDSNDGLTFATAFATFSKALSVSRIIYAERATYNESIIAIDIDHLELHAYDDGTSYTHAEPTRSKVSVKSGSFTHCDNLKICDFAFVGGTANSSCKVANSDNVYIYNCEANNSTQANGFAFTDANGTLDMCYATGNRYDGFNFHSFGVTVLNDCVSIDNTDDGCSHHDGCIGFINGGQFNGNGKAGIAPAYGARVEINNVLCKDNDVIGIGYLTTDNGHLAMTGMINSCALVGNAKGLQVDALCSVIAINCKYYNNTTDKNITGTLVEY